MKLDLRREFADIHAHVADRVCGFDPASNDGPGKPGPVKMIVVGFEYAQAAWVAVVFDTRPTVEPDGHWQFHIMGNKWGRPDWLAASEANLEGPITLVRLDGTETVLPKCTELAQPLGELLKAVVLKTRDDGVFAGLPKAPGCELCIEHHEGAYFWPASGEDAQEIA